MPYQTITLVILLAPGLFFRRAYYTSEFSREYFKISFFDLIISSIVPSVLVHTVFLCIINSQYQIDLSVFAILFSGTSESEQIEQSFQKINKFLPQIALYFFSAIIFMVLLGFLFKLIVRKRKWDRSYSFFRFQNEWHYVFSGEILDFPLTSGKTEDVEFVYVDALVDSNSDGLIIYSGILENYILNNENGIDRIYLSDVTRRLLKNDPKGERDERSKNYYDMPGELFILPYEKIINLHITYYSVDLKGDVSSELEGLQID